MTADPLLLRQRFFFNVPYDEKLDDFYSVVCELHERSKHLDIRQHQRRMDKKVEVALAKGLPPPDMVKKTIDDTYESEYVHPHNNQPVSTKNLLQHYFRPQIRLFSCVLRRFYNHKTEPTIEMSPLPPEEIGNLAKKLKPHYDRSGEVYYPDVSYDQEYLWMQRFRLDARDEFYQSIDILTQIKLTFWSSTDIILICTLLLEYFKCFPFSTHHFYQPQHVKDAEGRERLKNILEMYARISKNIVIWLLNVMITKFQRNNCKQFILIQKRFKKQYIQQHKRAVENNIIATQHAQRHMSRTSHPNQNKSPNSVVSPLLPTNFSSLSTDRPHTHFKQSQFTNPSLVSDVFNSTDDHTDIENSPHLYTHDEDSSDDDDVFEITPRVLTQHHNSGLVFEFTEDFLYTAKNTILLFCANSLKQNPWSVHQQQQISLFLLRLKGKEKDGLRKSLLDYICLLQRNTIFPRPPVAPRPLKKGDEVKQSRIGQTSVTKSRPHANGDSDIHTGPFGETISLKALSDTNITDRAQQDLFEQYFFYTRNATDLKLVPIDFTHIDDLSSVYTRRIILKCLRIVLIATQPPPDFVLPPPISPSKPLLTPQASGVTSPTPKFVSPASQHVSRQFIDSVKKPKPLVLDDSQTSHFVLRAVVPDAVSSYPRTPVRNFNDDTAFTGSNDPLLFSNNKGTPTHISGPQCEFALGSAVALVHNPANDKDQRLTNLSHNLDDSCKIFSDPALSILSSNNSFHSTQTVALNQRQPLFTQVFTDSFRHNTVIHGKSKEIEWFDTLYEKILLYDLSYCNYQLMRLSRFTKQLQIMHETHLSKLNMIRKKQRVNMQKMQTHFKQRETVAWERQQRRQMQVMGVDISLKHFYMKKVQALQKQQQDCLRRVMAQQSSAIMKKQQQLVTLERHVHRQIKHTSYFMDLLLRSWVKVHALQQSSVYCTPDATVEVPTRQSRLYLLYTSLHYVTLLSSNYYNYQRNFHANLFNFTNLFVTQAQKTAFTAPRLDPLPGQLSPTTSIRLASGNSEFYTNFALQNDINDWYIFNEKVIQNNKTIRVLKQQHKRKQEEEQQNAQLDTFTSQSIQSFKPAEFFPPEDLYPINMRQFKLRKRKLDRQRVKKITKQLQNSGLIRLDDSSDEDYIKPPSPIANDWNTGSSNIKLTPALGQQNTSSPPKLKKCPSSIASNPDCHSDSDNESPGSLPAKITPRAKNQSNSNSVTDLELSLSSSFWQNPTSNTLHITNYDDDEEQFTDQEEEEKFYRSLNLGVLASCDSKKIPNVLFNAAANTGKRRNNPSSPNDQQTSESGQFSPPVVGTEEQCTEIQHLNQQLGNMQDAGLFSISEGPMCAKSPIAKRNEMNDFIGRLLVYVQRELFLLISLYTCQCNYNKGRTNNLNNPSEIDSGPTVIHPLNKFGLPGKTCHCELIDDILDGKLNDYRDEQPTVTLLQSEPHFRNLNRVGDMISVFRYLRYFEHNNNMHGKLLRSISCIDSKLSRTRNRSRHSCLITSKSHNMQPQPTPIQLKLSEKVCACHEPSESWSESQSHHSHLSHNNNPHCECEMHKITRQLNHVPPEAQKPVVEKPLLVKPVGQPLPQLVECHSHDLQKKSTQSKQHYDDYDKKSPKKDHKSRHYRRSKITPEPEKSKKSRRHRHPSSESDDDYSSGSQPESDDYSSSDDESSSDYDHHKKHKKEKTRRHEESHGFSGFLSKIFGSKHK